MTKTLLPAITDEMTSDEMKSAKLHFEGLGFSMPGWAKASRDRKVAWLRKTFTEASEQWQKSPPDRDVADRMSVVSDAMATAQHESHDRGQVHIGRVLPDGTVLLPNDGDDFGPIAINGPDVRLEDGSMYDLKTVVEKVEGPGMARKLGAKMMDFTAAVIEFVMGEQSSPDTAIPLLGRLMVNANMNFASGLKRGEPSPANLRAAKRLAEHRKTQKARLSASAEAEDFIVSRQVRRHMMRIAAKFERTERKEEAMSSRAMGGAAAVV